MRAIWPGALLVVYLLATGVLLITGPGGARLDVVLAHFAVLFAIAATTWLRATPYWIRAWAPLLVLLFLYSELPALIHAAGHTATFDGTVVAWEQTLFGGQPAQTWAQSAPWPALSEVLHLAYLAYYPVIYVVPALLWYQRRNADFSAAVFALMLTFVACCVCYIAFPVAGPRYFWTSAAPDGVFRRLATWLLETRSSRGTAFPSSHVAVAVTQSVLAVRFFGAGGGIVALTAVGLALGAIYGGFHYAVDVLAGSALGLITAWVGLRVFRALAPAADQANAMAPTYPGSER